MSSDIVVCNIQGEMGEQFQVRCGGFRGTNGNQPRMTMLDFKYPAANLIGSLYLCEDSDEAKYILDIDLVQKYLDNKVIELEGYYALQPFKDLKQHRGLAPKQIAAVLPVLKREYGIEFVILHAEDDGSGKLVEHYESFGMRRLSCHYKSNMDIPSAKILYYDEFEDEPVLNYNDYRDNADTFIRVLRDQHLEKDSELRGHFFQHLMIGHIDHMISGSTGRRPDQSFRTDSSECVGMNTFESLEPEGCKKDPL